MGKEGYKGESAIRLNLSHWIKWMDGWDERDTDDIGKKNEGKTIIARKEWKVESYFC